MCSCDYDEPRVFREEYRRASKRHRCEECRSWIMPGERHHYAAGVWHDGWDQFRTCMICDAWREAYMDLLPECCVPAFGQLVEAWTEVELIYQGSTESGEPLWYVDPLDFPQAS